MESLIKEEPTDNNSEIENDRGTCDFEDICDTESTILDCIPSLKKEEVVDMLEFETKVKSEQITDYEYVQVDVPRCDDSLIKREETIDTIKAEYKTESIRSHEYRSDFLSISCDPQLIKMEPPSSYAVNTDPFDNNSKKEQEMLNSKSRLKKQASIDHVGK